MLQPCGLLPAAEGKALGQERRTQLQEEADLEAADGLSATGDASLHAATQVGAAASCTLACPSPGCRTHGPAPSCKSRTVYHLAAGVLALRSTVHPRCSSLATPHPGRSWHARRPRGSLKLEAFTLDPGLTLPAQPAHTQIFEAHFDSVDGTDADTSVDKAAEQAKVAKQQELEAARVADEVNKTPGEKYHVICSLGAGIYTQWQSRVVRVGGQPENAL